MAIAENSYPHKWEVHVCKFYTQKYGFQVKFQTQKHGTYTPVCKHGKYSPSYEFGTYSLRLIPRVQDLPCCACYDTKQLNWANILGCIYDDFFERPATASKTSHGHKNFKCQTVWSTLDQSIHLKNLNCRGRETFLFSFNYVNLSCHHEHLVR